ncbi:MAG: DUF3332 family protein [Bacteroidetes bacterium]|nr:DUF3332 family protein [Bacteroidota bacterium]
MNKMFKQVVIALLIATMALMSVGCYGSFNLTKKVYNWNGSLGDKWVVELVFLAANIIPVYSIAGFIDVVILNSLEFWTGSNPVASSVTSEDGTTVAFNKEKNEMTLSYGGKTFVITREEGRSVVKDTEGNVLATAVSDANGTMNVVDAQGNILSSYSSSEVSAMLATK